MNINKNSNVKFMADLIKAFDEIRPFIEADGGNIELVKFEEGIVYVKLQGNCTHCPMSAITLKFGLEQQLKERFKEVTEVVAID